jgi:hypothetical protein
VGATKHRIGFIESRPRTTFAQRTAGTWTHCAGAALNDASGAGSGARYFDEPTSKHIMCVYLREQRRAVAADTE